MSAKKTKIATASLTRAAMRKKATQLQSYIGKQLQNAAKAPPGTVKITFSVKTLAKTTPSLVQPKKPGQHRGKSPFQFFDQIITYPPGLPLPK
jgi:hypothetical protein